MKKRYTKRSVRSSTEVSIKCATGHHSDFDEDFRFRVCGYYDTRFRDLAESATFDDLSEAEEYAHSCLDRGPTSIEDYYVGSIYIDPDEYWENFDGDFACTAEIANWQNEVWKSMGIGASTSTKRRHTSRPVLCTRDTQVSQEDVRELVLYITNDGRLYEQMAQPIIKNMKRKRKSGKYDDTLAVKGWMHLADEGVRRYDKEFGSGKGSLTMLNKATREAIAEELKEYYEDEVSYDETTASTRTKGKRPIKAASKRNYAGLPDVFMRYYNEWADPEIEYNGKIFNLPTLEESLADYYDEYLRENNLADDNYDNFYSWISDNSDYVYEWLGMMENDGLFKESPYDGPMGDYLRKSVRSSTCVKGKKPIKAAKVYTDGFGSYTPWSGATQTWSILERFDRLDDLEEYIDEVYYNEEMGEGVINETELNDLLWFEPETVYEVVGLYYNEETDEVSDEPFEDEEDDEEEVYV